MIRILTPEGQFDIPAAAQDVTTTGGLKILDKGNVVAEFSRWHHWIEIPDPTDKDQP